MALRRSPALASGIKGSGQNPTAGWVGKLLYSAGRYTARSAETSLDRSLSTLQTDYIDVFLLHDPTGDMLSNGQNLIEYLNEQISIGRIRSWGVASDTYGQSESVSGVLQEGQVMQLRDDILDECAPVTKRWDKTTITFGFMETALPSIQGYLKRSSDEGRKFWSNRLGADLSDPTALPNLLLGYALHRNQSGPVLFSSTRIDRVFAAANEAREGKPESLIRDKAAAMAALIAAVRSNDPQWSGLDN